MHAIKVRNHVGFKDCVLDALEPETNCPVTPRILLCLFLVRIKNIVEARIPYPLCL